LPLPRIFFQISPENPERNRGKSEIPSSIPPCADPLSDRRADIGRFEVIIIYSIAHECRQWGKKTVCFQLEPADCTALMNGGARVSSFVGNSLHLRG
jgi:hypothetical protein